MKPGALNKAHEAAIQEMIRRGQVRGKFKVMRTPTTLTLWNNKETVRVKI